MKGSINDFVGATISVGCMLAINNLVEAVRKTDDPRQQIIAMVGFGCMCVADPEFLKIRESDKAQWIEQTKKLKDLALEIQKDLKENEG